VTGAGWALIGLSVLVAVLKLEWGDAGAAALIGTIGAFVIQHYGRRNAACRRRDEEREAVEVVSRLEQERSAIDALVGREGVTLTELKTCGSVQLGEIVVDARSGRGYVPRDTRVVVRRIEGKTPIVEVLAS
jgi:hypothetical protein